MANDKGPTLHRRRKCWSCRFCSPAPDPFWCALHQGNNNAGGCACEDYEEGSGYVPDMEFAKLPEDAQEAWISKARERGNRFRNPVYRENPSAAQRLAVAMWWDEEGHAAFMKERQKKRTAKDGEETELQEAM